MAATPKPIRKAMKSERVAHLKKSTQKDEIKKEIHNSSYGISGKQSAKKNANQVVKHMNKLNVFESPKHEKLRKQK